MSKQAETRKCNFCHYGELFDGAPDAVGSQSEPCPKCKGTGVVKK